MCKDLPTHATSPTYFMYIEYIINFMKGTNTMFVLVPFCEILSELYANPSKWSQGPFYCAEGPSQRSGTAVGQQAYLAS
jgi:hypothetical protein